MSVNELVRGGGSQSDLLRAVAQVIASKLGYRIVVVNLFRPEEGDFVVAECVGSAEAERKLIGRTSPWSAWKSVLDRAAVVVGEAHFLPAGTNDWGAEGPPTWMPPEHGRDDPAAWHAEDALVVRMTDGAGRVLGMISVDDPGSGLRPSRGDLAMLSAFCGHLASALEMASINAVNRRQGLALARLAELSAAARHVTDPVPVLEEVVVAAGETLELSSIEIVAMREGELRDTASWGEVSESLVGWTKEHLTATITGAPHRDGVLVIGGAEDHGVVCELRDLRGKFIGALHAEAVKLPGGEEAARRQLLRTFADAAQAAVGSAVHGAVVLSEARKDAMLASSLDAIVTTDQGGNIAEFNPAAERMFGYAAKDVIGQALAELVVPERKRAYQRGRFAAFQGGERFEVMAMRADQSEFPAEISIGRVEWESTVLVISYVRDITSQREAQAELERRRLSAEHAANHDAVTGLLNTRGLHDQVTAQHAPFDGALNLSLVGAASIYEGFGQTVGDTMMRTVAERISAVAAKHGAIVARAGDWDFHVICRREVIDDLARACREAVQKPLDVQDIAIALQCRLGAVAEPADRLGELLRRAIVARRQSGGQPGGTFVLNYYREQEDVAASQLRTASDLRTAIAEGGLLLHYQPLFGVPDGRLRSLEALVRWSRDDGRLVPPLDFIPLAEATGLIAPLAEWVLEETCRQIAAWEEAGVDVPQIAINLSPYQLPHHDFPAVMRGTLARYRLEPDRLCIEVTETALQVGDGKMEHTLNQLRALGVECALDDFGADYSSLTRLATLPFSMVKLDRSFLTNVPTDERATALVSAIAGLAASLGLQTTAEGVESTAQLEVLASAGIDAAQGFLLGRPMPAAQAHSLLTTQDPLSRSR